MWKKRMLCLTLALCAVLLTACQPKEVFDTNLPSTERATDAPVEQNLFGTDDGNAQIDFDDGTYDPESEEGDDWEDLTETEVSDSEPTAFPTVQSEYAGATPVIIDPIDKPTPTPLPKLAITYQTYEAASLHMTFEGPAGWEVDDTQPDTFVLTNPDKSMDYAASMTVRAITVNKHYVKNDLTKEVKGMLDTLRSSGNYSRFEPSNTANRTFLNGTGVYANYKAVLQDGTLIAGRMIVGCVEKKLYTLHVTYPRGYTEFYVTNVYDKFRHSVKLTP